MRHQTQAAPEASVAGECVPITICVPGSPFQPRDIVRVVDTVDIEVHDVRKHLGRLGLVVHLEYSCGCGQSYPDYPAIGVKFANGQTEEFWPEEVLRVRARSESS
jgi:hypothetical protein